MNDGTQTVELLLRAGLALKTIMLRMFIEILKAAIKHMEWLQQNNIKPGLKRRIDKMQTKTVKVVCNAIEKKINVCKIRVDLQEKKIDKFKLDKQYELEKYNVEVLKAQKALDVAKENEAPKEEIAKLQKEIDSALDNKRDFEYKTNKEILKLNGELNRYKQELNETEYDLKVSNAKLNSLESNRNIETGRVKREYGNIVDKYMNPNDREFNKTIENNKLDEIEQKLVKNDLSKEQQVIKEKIADDIDKFQDAYKDVEQNLNKDNVNLDDFENSIDNLADIYSKTEMDVNNLEADINKDDIVEWTFRKDPEALKVYREMKSKDEFVINAPKKEIDNKIAM